MAAELILHGPDVLQIVVQEGDWHRSEFPDPLTTVDYDPNDQLLGLTIVGEPVVKLVQKIEKAIC